MARRKANNMVDQLRDAIASSGISLYAVAKGSGVDYAAVLRFMSKERGLNFDSAAKIARLLGLELQSIRKGGS